MDLYLARHGESLANSQGIYQGQSYDTDLSETGKKQAQALAKALNGKIMDRIYTSPLKRALQTAQIVSQGLLIEPPIADHRLIEINHGLWEGKTKDQIQTEFYSGYQAWKNEPDTVSMPDGETLDQLLDRSINFLTEVTTHDHQRILVITHDAVIRSLLTKLLLRQLKDIWLYQLDAGGYSVLEWNGQFKQVVKINANEHLQGIASDLSNHAL